MLDAIGVIVFGFVRLAFVWLHMFIKHGSVKKASAAMINWQERRQSIGVAVMQVVVVLLMSLILVSLVILAVRVVTGMG